MPEPAAPAVLPGAEPFSAAGGPMGALVLHGFTGCPQSMRGLAQAFAAAGFTVELPRLPGHGTSVEDMTQYSWADWSAAASSANRASVRAWPTTDSNAVTEAILQNGGP